MRHGKHGYHTTSNTQLVSENDGGTLQNFVATTCFQSETTGKDNLPRLYVLMRTILGVITGRLPTLV